MRSASIRGLLTFVVMLFVSVAVSAQEATFTGTVTDATGGVLPGVTVTAVHAASGNTFTTVTDERGEFRLPVRVGNYALTVELSGFSTVNRSLQILIGQTAEVDVQMTPSSVQETVTVTGEAPLVDTTTSTVGAWRTSPTRPPRDADRAHGVARLPECPPAPERPGPAAPSGRRRAGSAADLRASEKPQS